MPVNITENGEDPPESNCNSTYSESITNDDSANTRHESFKENIYLLRTVYNNIGKIIKLVNSAYGAVVLFCTMTAFFTAVFSISLAFSVLGSQSTYFDEINSIVVYLSISWACLYISQTVAIVYSCSATVTAARMTGVLVQDLLLKPGVDKEEQQELKEFLDQVHNTDVAFTGAGFFTMNLALLPSMAGSVTSYILVLLQLTSPEKTH
ncbi:putative gustatory receptor 28b [Bacillus rossius redtenbacheri]|uniref:putative gustatory receptor 28b n=1 Tax=Bacillus rossius redtenbacheri TaxID=93214 RepID=UPI002FDDFD17